MGALAGVGLLVRLWLNLAEEARAAAAADAVRASTAGRREHHRNVSRNIIERYHAAVKARDGLSEDKFTCVPDDDLLENPPSFRPDVCAHCATCSVMMPSFGRPMVLRDNLERIAMGAIPSISEIVVIWGSIEAQGPPPKDLVE